MTNDLDQKIASVRKVWDDPASGNFNTDVVNESQPHRSRSPPFRSGPYPPGVGPIGSKNAAAVTSQESALTKQFTKLSTNQFPPQNQYQRSLSGNFMDSGSPPVNPAGQVASPPPQLNDSMRQHTGQHHAYAPTSSGQTTHPPSISTPPVNHPIYNMATIASMYPPAFNQHMDPRASAQLQAFAQQLAFHQSQSQQASLRASVQNTPYAAPTAPQSMSDFRGLGPAAASGVQHPQSTPQHQQSNLMKQAAPQFGIPPPNVPNVQNQFHQQQQQQQSTASYYQNQGFYSSSSGASLPQHVYSHQQPHHAMASMNPAAVSQQQAFRSMVQQQQQQHPQQQQQQQQAQMGRGPRNYNH